MLLEGRLVAITGAGSGIGRALAQAFAAEGARLLLIGRRRSALDETAALLPKPDRTIVVPADITSTAGRAAVLRICREQGQLDILVNNAGLVSSGLLTGLADDELEQVLRTNVLAPIALTRDLVPLLRLSDRPRVVNIGSVFGDIGHPYFAAYCASKFALRGFSDAIRRELAPQGIGVTYAAPRATQTPAAAGFGALVGPFAMALDRPEAVAARIVAAVAAEARTVYPRGAESLFVAIQRLLPRLIDAALIAKTRKLQRAVP